MWYKKDCHANGQDVHNLIDESQNDYYPGLDFHEACILQNKERHNTKQ